MSISFKRMLIEALWLTMGRKNLVRLGRFLSNAARLDEQNSSSTNGEYAIQKCIFDKNKNSEVFCVFDVGANVGNWTTMLLNIGNLLCKNVTVHAFEPCTETFQTLTRNLKDKELLRFAHINNVALSSSAEKRLFYSSGENLGINGLYPIRNQLHQSQSIVDIETNTLDGYCKNQGIYHIDFIKIDTEGHDFEVLYGATNLLSNGAIDILQFEYNHRWIDARHYLRDAFDFLLPMDYSLGKVTSKGIEFYNAWDPELETFREGNYLAVKKIYKNIFPQILWWNH